MFFCLDNKAKALNYHIALKLLLNFYKTSNTIILKENKRSWESNNVGWPNWNYKSKHANSRQETWSSPSRDCSVNRGLGGTGQSLGKLATFEIFLHWTYENRLNELYSLEYLYYFCYFSIYFVAYFIRLLIKLYAILRLNVICVSEYLIFF